MFPSQDHGRFSVSDDGTLVIDSAQREDAGDYICKALSISGSAYAKATLEVKGWCCGLTWLNCLSSKWILIRKSSWMHCFTNLN